MNYADPKAQILNFAFTLIEVSVVLAISLVIMTFAIVGISSFQSSAYLDTSLEVFISDIKSQQNNAMNGVVNESGNTSTYGVHFNENTYTLFTGSVYNPNNESNFEATLDGNVIFQNITLPNNEIIFQKGSGEIEGYVNGLDSISILSPSGEEVLITFNKLGVITSL